MRVVVFRPRQQHARMLVQCRAMSTAIWLAILQLASMSFGVIWYLYLANQPMGDLTLVHIEVLAILKLPAVFGAGTLSL